MKFGIISHYVLQLALLSNVLGATALAQADVSPGFQFPAPVPVIAEGQGRLELQHSLKCVDVFAGSRDNDAKITQQTCTGLGGQLFEFRESPTQAGYYTIVNSRSGRCLDVVGHSNPGANVVQWDCHGGDNQLFKPIKKLRESFNLRVKGSELCLNLLGNDNTNGRILGTWTCDEGKNALFNFVPRFSGYDGSRALLEVGAFLRPGNSLRSPKNAARMYLQPNGELCIKTTTGQQVWCSGASGPIGDYYAILQLDGNLCVQRGKDPTDNQGVLWCKGLPEGGVDYYALVNDRAELEVRAMSRSKLQYEGTIDEATAKKYAPRIHFQSDESYWPSSVDLFLANTHEESGFLTTNVALDCPGCANIPFLAGQRPDQNSVPIYAHIVPRIGFASKVVDIVYWAFFPYNNGKRVCVGVYDESFLNLGCLGKYSIFGNHVGDWEHVTVRFVDGYPQELAMEAHGNTSIFPWGSRKVEMLDQSHPIVYSAQGSHGFYEYAGRNRYKDLPNGDFLVDDMNAGVAWDTWNNVVPFFYQDVGSYEGANAWVNYKGRWGNAPAGCGQFNVIQEISGECVLNPGPSSPFLGGMTQLNFMGIQ